MFLIILSTPYIASYLRFNLEKRVSYTELNSLPDIDVVVVLAAGVKKYKDPLEDELASPYRVIKSAWAFKKTKARLLVMSGGTGIKGENRMVRTMKRLAIELGIPEEKVILDSMSRNTFEHAISVSKMSEIKEADRIGLVTTAWHMPRAFKEFQRRFAYVVPISCGKKFKLPSGLGAWLPNVSALSASTMIIQERIGYLWYRFLPS